VSGAARLVRGEVADLAGAIERASGDLALQEEPAGFVTALERAAPGAEPHPPPGPSDG
jgi:hypothetical protein